MRARSWSNRVLTFRSSVELGQGSTRWLRNQKESEGEGSLLIYGPPRTVPDFHLFIPLTIHKMSGRQTAIALGGFSSLIDIGLRQVVSEDRRLRLVGFDPAAYRCGRLLCIHKPAVILLDEMQIRDELGSIFKVFAISRAYARCLGGVGNRPASLQSRSFAVRDQRSPRSRSPCEPTMRPPLDCSRRAPVGVAPRACARRTLPRKRHVVAAW